MSGHVGLGGGGTVWAFQKAVNSLLIVKETTAVSAPAGPRGFVLCRTQGPFICHGVSVGVTGG